MKKQLGQKDRLDQLLRAMVTQPVPSEKLAIKARPSKQATGQIFSASGHIEAIL